MEFKKFSVGENRYGTDDKPKDKQLEFVNFTDPEFDKVMKGGTPDRKEEIENFMEFLALCHSIVVNKEKNEYNGASPDEYALVNFSKQFKYEFFDKDENNIIIL